MITCRLTRDHDSMLDHFDHIIGNCATVGFSSICASLQPSKILTSQLAGYTKIEGDLEEVISEIGKIFRNCFEDFEKWKLAVDDVFCPVN
jgi:hypothetical protein